MPRYFFNVHGDDDSYFDATGLELSGVAEARRHAILASSDMLRDEGLEFWSNGHWRMDVVGDAGVSVLRLTFAVETHSNAGDGRRLAIVAPSPA